MRRKRIVVQERFPYTVSELRQLETELIENINNWGLSPKERAMAISIVHTKLSTMRKYVAAQAHLAAEGDLVLTDA